MIAFKRANESFIKFVVVLPVLTESVLIHFNIGQHQMSTVFLGAVPSSTK